MTKSEFQDHSGASVDPASAFAATASTGHFVQFYDDETYLMEAVARFATKAIRAEEALVVIATEAHRIQLDAHLERAGMNPAALQETGQYVAIDADQTLARFMLNGQPDFTLFHATIGPVLSQAEQKWPRVRAFGEMVARLCEQGNAAAACQLERQWNALAAVHDFELFCAYPLVQFQDEASDSSYRDICASHSHVIPTEKFVAEHATASDASRTIALLEQRTQRLEREVELRKLAQRELSDFMDNAIVGLHKVDPSGRILWANAAELTMLGFEADEYIEHSVLDFHVDSEVGRELLNRLRGGEQLVEYPACLRCKDGSIRHVRISSNGYFENGQFVYSRCVTRDVTDSVALDGERALLATIVDSSQDAIVTKTLDGTITSWNPAAERMFGYKSAEAVGKHISLIIPRERLDEEQEIVSKLRRGERIEHYETVRLTKDGRPIEISLTISPIRNSAGRIIGASKIARDVGARKAADRALRESEQRFSSFMQCLPGLAWIKDADGRYVFANEAVEKPFGVARENLLGRTDKELFDEDTAAQIVDGDRTVLQTGQGIKVVEKLDQDDGLHHYVISKFPISGTNVKAGYIGGVAIDITERIRAEHALRESDRRKDEFLATLAHELRNPLAPIRNSLRFLRMSKADSADTGPVYEMMERQVVHMVRLVDDLLELSRISRGKIELRREYVALSVIVEMALDTSRPMIERGSHKVDIELPQEPILLFGDSIRLSQVFSNLFNNASKYTSKPGTIRFRARRDGDVVVASIRDSGIGIPAGMLSRVFEMFAQVENPLRQNQDGLGIGLSLVRTLVQMHGGEVEARSAGLGQGSEFIVTLPVATGDAELTKGAVHEPAPALEASCRILAVDDNRDAADSLGMMLRCLGADVSVAYDGPSAIEEIRIGQPSVVLMDIGMPRMNGYDVAREIRKDPQNDSVLLVALTGWGQEQDRQRSKEAGFDHHLVKPVELDALKALLSSRQHSN